MNSVTLNGIEKSLVKLNEFIHTTPVMKSNLINTLVNRNVYFKCEHLQKTGSFKIRGALNNISSRLSRKTVLGVVTHSSGNHGQAVAAAAKMLNIPTIVVVPNNTSRIKCDAIRHYGAELRFCDNSPQARFNTCQEIADELQYEIIHPYDDYDTIEGQGTLGLEFIRQVPELDCVIISISGGGLTAGCAMAFKSIKPEIKVYCVEPTGKELGNSLRAKSRLWTGEPRFLDTIADGIRTQQPGKLTFPLLCDLVDLPVLTATDEDMVAGMKLSMMYLKQVIEPSAGAAVGALLKHGDRIPETCRNVGIILCGGNVDIDPMLACYH